jgi:hypothetical protein
MGGLFSVQLRVTERWPHVFSLRYSDRTIRREAYTHLFSGRPYSSQRSPTETSLDCPMRRSVPRMKVGTTLFIVAFVFVTARGGEAPSP